MQRQLLTLLLAALVFGAFASIALAQEAAQPAAPDEEKTELYRKYYEAPKATPEQQKARYNLAQEYLKKYGGDSDAYTAAVKKWVATYESLARYVDFDQAVKAKDFNKTFTVGRQILELEPENFKVLLQLVNAGLLNAQAGNTSLNTETIALTRKTIQLVDSKKVTDPTPMPSIDDVRGFLNFTLAFLLQATAPAEASAAALRAIKEGGAFKNDPNSYYILGATIYSAEYEPAAKEYSAKYAGKDETPESKAMLEKVNAIANRAIDAMARAVALATKPEHKDAKTKWLANLTDLYKDFHNNSDAGLSDLIATVLSKPMP
jgi:hypothetical protein